MEDELEKLPDPRIDAVRAGDKEPRKLLREAARPFAHPYYWSAFVLIGDPGGK